MKGKFAELLQLFLASLPSHVRKFFIGASNITERNGTEEGDKEVFQYLKQKQKGNCQREIIAFTSFLCLLLVRDRSISLIC